jgi:hypothetical protein
MAKRFINGLSFVANQVMGGQCALWPRPFQSPSFQVVPGTTQDLRRRTEIIPVKDSHTRTRIKPLALASGHGRYITVTPERALVVDMPPILSSSYYPPFPHTHTSNGIIAIVYSSIILIQRVPL